MMYGAESNSEFVLHREKNYYRVGRGIHFTCQKSAFYLIMVIFLSGVKDNVTMFTYFTSREATSATFPG